MTTPAPDSGTTLLEVSELTRSFAARKALECVSFSLRPGDCLAVFGPNGAGKTTLLRVLAGLLKPTAGTARLDGTMLPGGASTRSLVGVISHQTLLYSALSARENVMFAARLHGTDAPAARAAAALGRMGLGERADIPVRALSRGMQQRVSISRAMVHSPRLLLADEPYTGLDESGARALTGLLQEVRATGTTVVLVTHNLAEGLALATHAAVLRAGKLVRYDQRSGIDPARYADTYREAVAGGG